MLISKLATAKSLIADVSSVGPSSERFMCYEEVVARYEKRFKIYVHSTIKIVLKILPIAQKKQIISWKSDRTGFFFIKWLKNILKIIYQKRNIQREPQPIKCSHLEIMMPLSWSLIHQLCYYSVNKTNSEISWIEWVIPAFL